MTVVVCAWTHLVAHCPALGPSEQVAGCDEAVLAGKHAAGVAAALQLALHRHQLVGVAGRDGTPAAAVAVARTQAADRRSGVSHRG